MAVTRIAGRVVAVVTGHYGLVVPFPLLTGSPLSSSVDCVTRHLAPSLIANIKFYPVLSGVNSRNHAPRPVGIPCPAPWLDMRHGKPPR